MRKCMQCQQRGVDRIAERVLVSGEPSCATCYRLFHGPRLRASTLLEPPIKLGERLSELKRRQGVRSNEIQRALKASANQTSDYLHGRKAPSLKRFIILCEMLDTPPNTLLGYVDMEKVNLRAENLALTERVRVLEGQLASIDARYSRIDFPRDARHFPSLRPDVIPSRDDDPVPDT